MSANAAQLIKAEMGVEVACVDIGGWDTHVQQDTQMPALIDEFAKALAAFYTDLQEMQVLFGQDSAETWNKTRFRVESGFLYRIVNFRALWYHRT